MIEVRRRIQRIGDKGSRPAFDPDIFRSRYLQLTRADHLSDEQIIRLGEVLAGRAQLEAAWRMLQHLYGIHLAASDDEANQALAAFLDTYQDHPLLEFEKLCETPLERGDEIFAFHECDRVSNGRIEGTNNKIGVLKRISVNRPSRVVLVAIPVAGMLGVDTGAASGRTRWWMSGWREPMMGIAWSARAMMSPRRMGS